MATNFSCTCDGVRFDGLRPLDAGRPLPSTSLVVAVQNEDACDTWEVDASVLLEALKFLRDKVYEDDVVTGYLVLERKSVGPLAKTKKRTDPNMIERAARALSRTWDSIGMDCLSSLGNPKQVTMSKADVVDFVTACGFVGGYPETYGGDKEAVEWLESASKADRKRAINLAFPLTRYGM